jgi:uncharacterized protein
MQTSPSALVVSIHDVSPLTRERVGEMLSDLAALGVERTSLLVIPNHHYRAPMTEDPGFCQWLGDLSSRGHEMVLHGYHHRRASIEAGSAPLEKKGPSSSLRDHLITEYYTAGEGEFYDLSEPEARQRLDRGLEDFQAAGFHPTGFIAPAWLLGEEAERAVRGAGFSYTTRLKNFKDLESGREVVSQSLVWSVRSAWRRQVSRWWNASLATRLQGNPLARVGLHPPDWDHPAIRTQILKLVGAMLAGREVMTYDQWLAHLRTQ